MFHIYYIKKICKYFLDQIYAHLCLVTLSLKSTWIRFYKPKSDKRQIPQKVKKKCMYMYRT